MTNGTKLTSGVIGVKIGLRCGVDGTTHIGPLYTGTARALGAGDGVGTDTALALGAGDGVCTSTARALGASDACGDGVDTDTARALGAGDGVGTGTASCDELRVAMSCALRVLRAGDACGDGVGTDTARALGAGDSVGTASTCRAGSPASSCTHDPPRPRSSAGGPSPPGLCPFDECVRGCKAGSQFDPPLGEFATKTGTASCELR